MLKDGRTEIQVTLRTENALAWVIEGCNLGQTPTVFGNYPPDVLAGAEPAFGRASLTISYQDCAPGLPFLDLVQLFGSPEICPRNPIFGPSGQTPVKLTFSASAEGLLHENFGIPEGTPGKLSVTTVLTPLPSGEGSGVEDGIPVSRINVVASGE